MPRTPLATDLVMPIGVPMPWESQTLPYWALKCDGTTIGDATSGATGRANADTYTLYKFRWDNIANAEAPIQDSTGTPTTRGVDALSDFNAHKRMPLPNLKGAGIFGYDSGNVKFNAMGKKGGADGVTLGATHIPSHTHSGTTGNDAPDHTHTFTVYQTLTEGAGNPRSSVQPITPYNPATSGASTRHQHGFTSDGGTGGGQAHENMSPYAVYNYIVRFV